MRKATIVAAVAAIALAACAGTNFDWSQARQIKAGMSEHDLIALMGPPYMTAATAQGVRYTWSYANGMNGQSRAVSVLVKDGVVAQAPTIPDSYR
jgi:hypothetical protein